MDRAQRSGCPAGRGRRRGPRLSRRSAEPAAAASRFHGVDPHREAGGGDVKRYWVRLADEELEVGGEAAGGMLPATVPGIVYRVELTELIPSSYTLVVDETCHDLTVQDRSGP